MARARMTIPGTDPLSWPDELLSHGSPDPATTPIGRVNTPAVIARWMVHESLALVGSEAADARHADGGPSRAGDTFPAIVEPAAGSGVILGALAESLVRADDRSSTSAAAALNSVWAIDADGHARDLAGKRLAACLGESPGTWLQQQYRIGDALLQPELMPEAPVDLVIGNPPYLGLRHARRLEAFPAWQDRFGSPEDLYVYFIRWAAETVRPGGCVALLVPDGWLSLPGCECLREELLQGHFELISLLPRNTFSKRVNPCFFIWRRGTSAGPCRHVDLRDVTLVDGTSLVDLAKAREIKVDQAMFEASPRRRLVPHAADASQLAVLYSLANSSLPNVTKLAEVAGITDAGIHSRNCRHRLFHAERVKPGLHRLLQGRQIERYTVRWDAPNAQFRWVDIHYKPKPNTPGRRRDGTPSARNEYWDWQGSPKLHALPERILIRQTGDSIIAARCMQSNDVHYTDNTLFTAVLTDAALDKGITYLYLLAYLNSAIVTHLYRFMSCEQGRPQAQIKISLLRELPFAWPVDTERLKIEAAARAMELSAHDRHEAVAPGGGTEQAPSPSSETGPQVSLAQRAIDEHFDALLSMAAQDTLTP